MQTFNSRPSLQPIQRQPGNFSLPGRSLQVPTRGPLGYTPPVNQAMHHSFSDNTNVPPQYRSHDPASHAPTRSFANSNAALFGATLPEQPPYHSQVYTPGVVSRVPRRDIPFRAMLIALIVVVAAAGAYAGVRVFLNNQDPVNADDITNTATP